MVFEASGRSNVRVWTSLVVVCEPRRPGLGSSKNTTKIQHFVEITKRTRSWSSIVGHSFEPCHSHRLCVVQGSALASLLLSHAPADVAVFLTPLATIQRAVEQECWGGEGLQWRVWAHGFSAKLVHELPPMCLCVIWTSWCRTCTTGGAWRFPLFGGVQLVVDTTLVSPLRSDGSPRPHRCCERRCRSPGCKAPQGAHILRVGGARVRELGWLSGLAKLVGGGLVKW